MVVFENSNRNITICRQAQYAMDVEYDMRSKKCAAVCCMHSICVRILFLVVVIVFAKCKWQLLIARLHLFDLLDLPIFQCIDVHYTTRMTINRYICIA